MMTVTAQAIQRAPGIQAEGRVTLSKRMLAVHGEKLMNLQAAGQLYHRQGDQLMLMGAPQAARWLSAGKPIEIVTRVGTELVDDQHYFSYASNTQYLGGEDYAHGEHSRHTVLVRAEYATCTVNSWEELSLVEAATVASEAMGVACIPANSTFVVVKREELICSVDVQAHTRNWTDHSSTREKSRKKTNTTRGIAGDVQDFL